MESILNYSLPEHSGDIFVNQEIPNFQPLSARASNICILSSTINISIPNCIWVKGYPVGCLSNNTIHTIASHFNISHSSTARSLAYRYESPHGKALTKTKIWPHSSWPPTLTKVNCTRVTDIAHNALRCPQCGQVWGHRPEGMIGDVFSKAESMETAPAHIPPQALIADPTNANNPKFYLRLVGTCMPSYPRIPDNLILSRKPSSLTSSKKVCCSRLNKPRWVHAECPTKPADARGSAQCAVIINVRYVFSFPTTS